MTTPAQIPTGTVTLLFTDIEGSTRLWETEQDAMASALRLHDDIVRTAIEGAGGYVFKTVGDSFCAAFPAAGRALDAALTAQRAMITATWPTARPVKVRMGLHTGVCEERDGDYFGPVVNRSARLEAVAHGGQVLISAATAELLFESIPAGVNLRDLGLHRLKDLGRPEHIFEVEAGFLPSGFPPLASLDNPELPNNLPSVLSAFVGRERELAEVRALARSSRLVTLTGAGGSGKTRLALQSAADLVDASPDGVWLAELAPITDGGQVPAAVAAGLGLPDQTAGGSADRVVEMLTSQDVLILLDNCEHVIDAVAKFCEQVIRHCPRVRFLATAREPLGIEGEKIYRVPSMSLPEPDVDSTEELTSSDAVLLFAERARSHDLGFSLDDQSAQLVATICRRLDGIPLALELAAARLSSMSLRQVADRLDQRFRLLTGGSRNAMPRQQTLQATVDWSFGLLPPAEREMLTRLSVFAGGFELEAAEAVCTTTAIDALDVIDLLGSLVDKSLVVADPHSDSVRYRLLETIRQYSAQELLKTAGDAEVVRIRDRHAEFYLAMAEDSAPKLSSFGQGDALRHLDAEWDNLRACVTHLLAERRTEDVLKFCVALPRFAVSRGHAEVLDYLRQVIDDADLRPSAVVASALIASAWMTFFFGRHEMDVTGRARTQVNRALEISRRLGDRRLEARALSMLGGAAYFDRDMAAQRELCSEAVAIARQTGDPQLLGEVLGMQAVNDATEDARSIRLEALDCLRQCGDDLLAANELHMLYGLEMTAGRVAEAQGLLDEAIAVAQRLGDKTFLLYFDSDLAIALLMQDRHADAVPVVRRGLLSARRLGHRIQVCELFFGAACCATWLGEYERAARLHGAADRALDEGVADMTITWSPVEEELRQKEQRLLRRQMGDQHYDDGYRAGRSL
ncbi:MAG TPA: adenylate/guanylate cyclase domain-containing protein, partial [Streptosporangiaceae bacterium]|nr:adenylate/guanylate cyclase domain-containing protein [Streptosporangiaceae bacterium]